MDNRLESLQQWQGRVDFAFKVKTRIGPQVRLRITEGDEVWWEVVSRLNGFTLRYKYPILDFTTALQMVRYERGKYGFET